MTVRYQIRTVTPLAQVPLVFDVAEAKRHLNVDHGDDDALIEGFVRSAQAAVEKFTGQVLTARTLRWSAAAWPALPAPIRLWREPVTAIVAVEHVGADGAMVVLDEAAWRWSEADGDALLPAIGSDWPSLAHGLGAAAVRVTFAAGYEDGLCPPDLSAAVKLTVGWMYANREGGGEEAMPPGAIGLCRPYRRMVL